MKNLSINDSTQTALLKHITVTENLLAKVASKASEIEQKAEIILMPDLGLPYNVRRIHGGFLTGALYTWQTTVPFVPIDATVNVCSTSLFKLRNDIGTEKDFMNMLSGALGKSKESNSYVWNFNNGNHFIIYGEIFGGNEIPDGNYVILHSSAAEFKKQHNGLYPTLDNWYSDSIKTLQSNESNRYIRFIDGHIAERFIKLAQLLVDYQQIRHQYFANLIFGSKIDDEIIHAIHYGMPTRDSLAIGCHWCTKPKIFPLLTAHNKPVFIIKPKLGFQNHISVGKESLILTPHGLGVKWIEPLNMLNSENSLVINGKEFSIETSIMNEKKLKVRSFTTNECSEGAIPKIISNILKNCPAEIIATFWPKYNYDKSSSINTK